MAVDNEKKFENLIAGLRIQGLTVEEIREMFEGTLNIILADEKDGENLGKYGSQ